MGKNVEAGEKERKKLLNVFPPFLHILSFSSSQTLFVYPLLP